MSFPTPDLKLRNSTPYGVVIWNSYTDTTITVTLYSTGYATGAQTAQQRHPRRRLPAGSHRTHPHLRQRQDRHRQPRRLLLPGPRSRLLRRCPANLRRGGAGVKEAGPGDTVGVRVVQGFEEAQHEGAHHRQPRDDRLGPGAALEADGHDVVRLSRGSGTSSWDPEQGLLDRARPPAASRRRSTWPEPGSPTSAGHPSARRRSGGAGRFRPTCWPAVCAAMDPRPEVLVSGSAIGFYGSRGDEILDEDSPAGAGLPGRRGPAVGDGDGTRGGGRDPGGAHPHGGGAVPPGGALRKQLPLFRFGLGGRLASGEQYVSWITLDDEVAAIRHALDTTSLAGAVNLTAPNPVTNAEYTRVLGKALGRPTVLTVPSLRPRSGPRLGHDRGDADGQRSGPAEPTPEQRISVPAPHLGRGPGQRAPIV